MNVQIAESRKWKTHKFTKKLKINKMDNQNKNKRSNDCY